MDSILVVFDVMDRGLDDVVRADAVVHCLQAALVSPVHELDDFALLGREVAGHGKRSSDVSFVELIVETEIHQHCFSRLHCPVQEVIVVELLEDGPARYRAGLEFRPHRNPVRTGTKCSFDGSSFNLAASFMSTISAGLLTARIF